MVVSLFLFPLTFSFYCNVSRISLGFRGIHLLLHYGAGRDPERLEEAACPPERGVWVAIRMSRSGGIWAARVDPCGGDAQAATSNATARTTARRDVIVASADDMEPSFCVRRWRDDTVCEPHAASRTGAV